MAEAEAKLSSEREVASRSWRTLWELLGKIPRVGLLSILGPSVLLIAGYWLWISYGAKHLDRTRYGLRQENILLTAQPPWIRSPVLEEVYRGSDLGRLNVLDRQMSPTVSTAFQMHPWIRKVFRVQKLAGEQVEVLVEYREPLAMVFEEAMAKSSAGWAATRTSLPPGGEGTAEDSTASSSMNFYPVDVDGVLLPTKDFRPEEIPNYMLIYAQGSTPVGKKVGGEYGDSRIREALMICRLVRDERQALELERVYVYQDPDSEGPAKWIFELTTRRKTRVYWGHAPGREVAGEPGSPAKLRKLRELLLNPTPEQASEKSFDLVKLARPMISSRLGMQPGAF
jgi:hypothetical protein